MTKYTILTVRNGKEHVVLETMRLREARLCYSRLQACAAGRLRINNGPVLKIYEADKILGKLPYTKISPRALAEASEEISSIDNIISDEEGVGND